MSKLISVLFLLVMLAINAHAVAGVTTQSGLSQADSSIDKQLDELFDNISQEQIRQMLLRLGRQAEGGEDLMKKLHDELALHKEDFKSYMKLLYGASQFMGELLRSDSAQCFPIKENRHGSMDSVAKESSLEKLKVEFPFQTEFVFTPNQGDVSYKYFYTLEKVEPNGDWKLIRAYKTDKEGKNIDNLPLPDQEQQQKANRLAKEGM